MIEELEKALVAIWAKEAKVRQTHPTEAWMLMAEALCRTLDAMQSVKEIRETAGGKELLRTLYFLAELAGTRYWMEQEERKNGRKV